MTCTASTKGNTSTIISLTSIFSNLSKAIIGKTNDGDPCVSLRCRYIYYEKLSEADRQRTYLFNSFFYTRLTRQAKDDNPSISYVCRAFRSRRHRFSSNWRAAERRYNRVKRWLRDVDVFSKDYLIVPINQTAHWYIVLIHYPNCVPTEADLISDDEDDDDDDEEDSGRSGTEMEVNR